MNAQNVTQILDALAARFGTTAAHLWDVLIRQVYVEAVQGIIVYAILIPLMWRGWKAFAAAPFEEDDYTISSNKVALGVLLLFGFLFATAELVWFLNALAYVFNPEYGALRLVGEALGGK